MIRNFFSGRSLLARFTLVSFLVTALIATVLTWRLESSLEQDALSAVAENTAEQAKNILNVNLTSSDLKASLQGERYDEIDALIHDTLLSTNIVRIKIWNRNGLLIYSDDTSIMGKTFPITQEMIEAFSGEMATEISSLEAAENMDVRGLYNQLFEIYVPLQLANSSEVQGVYEVYYDLSKLQPRLLRIRYTVATGVSAAFLLLYGTLFLLIRNASRELIQRNKEYQALLITEHRERELAETLERVSRALAEILDLRNLLDLICRESVAIFGTHTAFLWLLEEENCLAFRLMVRALINSLA